MKILLDTNFLLVPGRNKVDIFRELERFGKPELFTLDLVVKELEILSQRSGKDASHAGLALELIEKKGVEVLESRGSKADLELERIASEGGYAVCTQDKELQKRLIKEEIVVIFLRQGRVLTKV